MKIAADLERPDIFKAAARVSREPLESSRLIELGRSISTFNWADWKKA